MPNIRPPAQAPVKKGHVRCNLLLGGVGLIVLLVIIAIAANPSKVATTISSATTPSTPSAAATETPQTSPEASAAASPAPTHLTAQQKAQVRGILTASLTHYQGLLAGGRAALGTTQYADAFAGLAAMQDPNSNAAKFRDWRKASSAENDVSFNDEFSKADMNYTAENEPKAIGDWRADMGDAQAALIQWVQLAVDWQISGKSNADLTTATKAVTDLFAKAQADIDATLAAS